MTQHYSVAQIVEIHSALEKIKDDTGRWNKSLAMLRREQQEGRGDASPPKVPQQEKRPRDRQSRRSSPAIQRLSALFSDPYPWHARA